MLLAVKAFNDDLFIRCCVKYYTIIKTGDLYSHPCVFHKSDPNTQFTIEDFGSRLCCGNEFQEVLWEDGNGTTIREAVQKLCWHMTWQWCRERKNSLELKKARLQTQAALDINFHIVDEKCKWVRGEAQILS